MANRGHKKRAVMALAVVGSVFLLHFLNALVPVVLVSAALGGTAVVIGLLMHTQKVRAVVKRVLHWLERRIQANERG